MDTKKTSVCRPRWIKFVRKSDNVNGISESYSKAKLVFDLGHDLLPTHLQTYLAAYKTHIDNLTRVHLKTLPGRWSYSSHFHPNNQKYSYSQKYLNTDDNFNFYILYKTISYIKISKIRKRNILYFILNKILIVYFIVFKIL